MPDPYCPVARLGYFLKATILGMALAVVILGAVYADHQIRQDFRMNNPVYSSPAPSPYPGPVQKKD